MLRRGAVVAALVVVALAVLPAATSTHEPGCKQDLETITIGTGNVGIDLAVLNRVNHVDIPHATCSSGRFTLDHSSDTTVLWEQHCADKFVRVYAQAGAVGAKVVLNWQPSTVGGCA